MDLVEPGFGPELELEPEPGYLPTCSVSSYAKTSHEGTTAHKRITFISKSFEKQNALYVVKYTQMQK